MPASLSNLQYISVVINTSFLFFCLSIRIIESEQLKSKLLVCCLSHQPRTQAFQTMLRVDVLTLVLCAAAVSYARQRSHDCNSTSIGFRQKLASRFVHPHTHPTRCNCCRFFLLAKYPLHLHDLCLTLTRSFVIVATHPQGRGSHGGRGDR